jgi:hypothetical protein
MHLQQLPGGASRGMIGARSTSRGNRPMEVPSPDDVGYLLSQPIVTLYWPLILGAVVMFILMVRGTTWVMLPIGAAFIALQMWHLGFFAPPPA